MKKIPISSINLFMYEIEISSTEKARLLSHAEYVLFDKGHWGDGAAMIPEEESLYNKIKQSDPILELTNNELDILMVWIFDSTDNGAILLNEDNSILVKIEAVLTDDLQLMEIKAGRMKSHIEQIKSVLKEIRQVSEIEKDEKKIIYTESEIDNKIAKIKDVNNEKQKFKDELKTRFKNERESNYIESNDSGFDEKAVLWKNSSEGKGRGNRPDFIEYTDQNSMICLLLV